MPRKDPVIPAAEAASLAAALRNMQVAPMHHRKADGEAVTKRRKPARPAADVSRQEWRDYLLAEHSYRTHVSGRSL